LRRGLLIGFAVLFAAGSAFMPFYRHRREQRRTQQLAVASDEIRNRFEAYTTALTNRDFVTTYRCYGSEFQQRTSFEAFREQQLKFGTIAKTRPVGAIQTEFANDPPAGRIIGFTVAEVGDGKNIAFFGFRFEKERGEWKIASVVQRNGAFGPLSF
jgi:hypothetical protein